jgi:hydrogenase maturation protein HypF
LCGIVQGVGFRPMLYNFAIQNNLKGYVCNSSDGLHFEINATKKQANKILLKIQSKAPIFAKITNATLNEVAHKIYTNFLIIEEKESNKNAVLLTPDYASCSQCKQEVKDENNRRHRYPFTTCTVCGPRYSIINTLPYDRVNTAMQPFKMCNTCKNEYEDIKNRRYFAQTISCSECGVQMKAFSNNKVNITNGNYNVLLLITEKLLEGKVLAIKGIGGYLLICDATNAFAVSTLRQRKNRPTKPFAIMVNNFEQAKLYAEINHEEKSLLESSIAPIVILKATNSELALKEIAPSLCSIGIMLAYTPLFNIILEDFGKPIVATSGNIAGSPIICKDEDAIEKLSVFADYIVTNNREIHISQDDSVMIVTPKERQQIILRRSRGLAPTYFNNETFNGNYLGTGAMLKSSFTVFANNNIYISQFLGNTDNYNTQQKYKSSLQHLQNIIGSKINEFIATDLHPNYFSHQFSKSINSNINVVQHHKAHFAAVLAENNLLQATKPILGVIWDGAGLGEDKQIWGSEFFCYQNNTIERKYCFDSFPQLLGDKMAKEPRLSALSICNDVMASDIVLQKKFTITEWKLYKKMLQDDSLQQNCSMGRIFDAVASLLDLCNKQSYEGEAALQLQNLANQYFSKHNYDLQDSYFTSGAHYRRIPTTTLINGVVRDILKQKDIAYIAAKFHFSLVHIIEIVAKNVGVYDMAFSGGVFQNSLLVDMLQHLLKAKYNLFFHKQLSPNDENISFGQAVYVAKNITNKTPHLNKQENQTTCV